MKRTPYVIAIACFASFVGCGTYEATVTTPQQESHPLAQQGMCADLQEEIALGASKLPGDEAWRALTRSAIFKIYNQSWDAVNYCESLGGNCASEHEQLSEARQDLQGSDTYVRYMQSSVGQTIHAARKSMQAAGCAELGINLWHPEMTHVWRLPY